MKLGDLVRVNWMDAAGFTSEVFSKAVPQKAVNVGVLVKRTPKYIVLCSGEYPDPGDEDLTGDYTVIPRGWIVKEKVIERAVQAPLKRKANA